jgi:hypothetical protein
MNLKEHIRKVLKEDHSEKMIKLIGKFMKSQYPYFNEYDARQAAGENRLGFIIVSYFDPKEGSHYATFREQDRELQLNETIFSELAGLFGDNIEYVIEWFNFEFGENAEYVTYYD